MNDHDLDVRLASWYAAASETRAPQRLREAVLGLPDASDSSSASVPTRVRRWGFRARGTDGHFALAVAVAIFAVIVAFSLLPVSGGVGGPPASASAPISSATTSGGASAAPTLGRIVGLPPLGTTPSSPEPGKLALQFDGTASGTSIWVYADGRLIWTRFHDMTATATDAFIGFWEQRLTPSGVAFLRSAAVRTGLFDRDLVLAREGSAPYLGMRVWNGDRLVKVIWAWRGITGDAPTASPDQVSALESLDQLLNDPASWPESAWADRVTKEFVPSEYLVCFEGRDSTLGDWQGPREPGGIWPLLPRPAQDLLRLDHRTPQNSMHSELGCARVTTDVARDLARIFDDAGIRRDRPEFGAFWLRYRFDVPDAPGSQVWIPFAPILPHGEAVYRGPG